MNQRDHGDYIYELHEYLYEHNFDNDRFEEIFVKINNTMTYLDKNDTDKEPDKDTDKDPGKDGIINKNDDINILIHEYNQLLLQRYNLENSFKTLIYNKN